MEHVGNININFILDPKTTHSARDLIWSVPWYQQGQNLAAKKSLHSRKKMGGIAAWVVVTSTSLTACLPGNLVGYHHLRKWSYWNLFIGRNVAGTVCVYFSKAVLAVGNIIIKQHALLWSWSLNGETMMKSNSWMISFNVYVWSLTDHHHWSQNMFGKYPTQPVSKIVCTCSIFQGFFRWLKNLRWKITLGICVRLFLPKHLKQT